MMKNISVHPKSQTKSPWQSQVKSQASVEATIIVGVLLIIFLIFFVINSDVAGVFNSRFAREKVKVALNDLESAANSVYSQGDGAKMTSYISLPSGVESSSVSGRTIKFVIYSTGEVTAGQDVYKTLNYNVSGSLPIDQGNYVITLESLGSSVQIDYD